MTGRRLPLVGKKRLRIYAGRSNPSLSLEIASHLGEELGHPRLADFASGEIGCELGESVRGADTFVIQTHCRPVNDTIMEQLIMIDAARRASAASITAVCPYYGYSRQDRKAEGREPITARLLADMMGTAGAQRIVSVDLHTGQIQGFFDGPFDHLTALPVLRQYVRDTVKDDVVVVAPDAGSIRAAERLARQLAADIAVVHKRHVAGVPNVVTARDLVGDVSGRTCVIVDDMIDTAGTICEAASMLNDRGAWDIRAVVTHGIFSGPALDRLKNSCIKRVAVTNTLPVDGSDGVDVLSVAQMIAQGIRAVFEGSSLSEPLRGREPLLSIPPQGDVRPYWVDTDNGGLGGGRRHGMASRDGGGRIVVGVDGSDGSLAALRWALDEAHLRGAILEVVGSWTDPLVIGGQGIPVGLGATMRNGTRRALRKGLAAAVEGAEVGVEIREAVICGRPAQVLSEISEDAEMLVVGSRGLGGFRGLALGSVSQQCAHHACCPVVIVPPPHDELESRVMTGDESSQSFGANRSAADRRPRVVVGVDGSAGAYLAMEWAASEARRRGAVLELVTAWSYPFGRHGKHLETIREEAEVILAESEKEAFEVDGSIPIEHRLVEAPAARGLLESSTGADLLVVGSRGRGGFGGLLLGSVSQACAGHADCPVVVIRPREL